MMLPIYMLWLVGDTWFHYTRVTKRWNEVELSGSYITFGLSQRVSNLHACVISNVTPLRITLAKRLLTFRQSIQKSDKSVLKQILNIVESDVRTVTGRNLRSILILTDKSSVQQLQRSDLEIISYYGEPEQWRIVSIMEVLQMRDFEMGLPDGWSKEEMQQILEAACCN